MRQIHVILAGLVLFVLTAPLAAQQNPTESDYYKIESLPIPAEAFLEAGALEIMPDGKLAVSSRRGEIWTFDDPTAEDLTKVTAQRFAGGLHEVLGLAWRKDWLYCVQRCELTRMKDTDGDGRADVFETVSDGWEISGDYHEYAFGSKFDPNGHLWVTLCLTGSFSSKCKYRGWCLRFDEDGKMIPTAGGIRSPGGMGQNLAGDVFYTDNQGPWNGTCSLKWLKPGSFQGHPGGNRWYEEAKNLTRPKDPKSGSRHMVEADKIPEYMPPPVLFPYNKMGKSASGITCDISQGKFGPFAGQLFVGDQSHSTVMRVCLEKVQGRYQGACFMFRQGVASGTLPMLMHKSGAMFIGGTNRGWGSRGGKPYSLERLRWTGKVPFEVHEMRAKPDGFELTFTQPVDPKTAADPASYSMKTYTYIFQASYGSPEVDHTTPTITSVSVSADNKSVRLTLDKLQRGHIHELHMRGVRSQGGLPLLHNVGYYTLNYIPELPRVAVSGKPYVVPSVIFKPRDPKAKTVATIHFRKTGQKVYQQAPAEIGDDGKLSAIVPATATNSPFEYYLEFAEAGQPRLAEPRVGAARPIQVLIDVRPPSVVAKLRASDIKDTSLRVSWEAAEDDRGIAGYRICRGAGDGFTCTDKNTVARRSDGQLSWIDPQPPQGTTAWYGIQAIDVAGRLAAPSYVKVIVPANLPPAMELTLTAIAAGEQAFLRWSGPLDTDVIAIEVLRGEGEDGPLKTIKTITDLATNRLVDKGLKADLLYRYAVRLVDRGKLTSAASKPLPVRAGLFIKRINCGGTEFVGPDGIPWEADKGRVGGTGTWNAKQSIADADGLSPVYQTERWSNNSLKYSLKVKPGRYQLILHFAETNRIFSKTGKRTFDVLVNGKKIHSAVDVFAAAGANHAWQLAKEIAVKGDIIELQLKKVKAGPAIKGIEIRAIP
jgi:glucose/arabinose dehydrogenase